MTYIDYLNQFNQWLESNTLPTNAVALYFRILHFFNRRSWPESVRIDTLRLMMMAGSQKDAAYRARDKLVDAGFLDYKKGCKGKPTLYFLSDKTTESATVNATESATVNATVNATQEKEKRNKTKKEDTPQPPTGPGRGVRMDYEAYRQIFLEECPGMPKPGPASGWSDARKKALRARCVSLEEFRAVCQRVQQSDFLTGRASGFHGCSLDWILKAANWQKITEGNYDNRGKASAGDKHTSYDIEDLEAMSTFILPEDL